MNKMILNVVLAVSISASAFAMNNLFSIDTDEAVTYSDIAYNGGELSIKGEKVGSSSEVLLKVELFKKIGSKVEIEKFVGDIEEGTELPTAVEIYKSNDGTTRAGSSSEGEMNIDVATETQITGTLFEETFNSKAVTE